MLGFMRSAAVELATSGVTINAVLPGNVQTPGFADTTEEHQREMLSSIPMRRYADPEDVGWAVRFLVLSRSELHHRSDAGSSMALKSLPEGSSGSPSSAS